MNNCSMCGAPVPDGQNVCSMCYGDMSYGQDHHYEEWAKRQVEKTFYDRDEPQENWEPEDR